MLTAFHVTPESTLRKTPPPPLVAKTTEWLNGSMTTELYWRLGSSGRIDQFAPPSGLLKTAPPNCGGLTSKK